MSLPDFVGATNGRPYGKHPYKKPRKSHPFSDSEQEAFAPYFVIKRINTSAMCCARRLSASGVHRSFPVSFEVV